MVEYPEEIEIQLAELREHYELIEQDGRGANGYLFFAKNKISGQEVAIKFYCGAPDETQHDEPRQLATIASPNVLPILDAKSVSGSWGYFVTPKCADGDLDDVIGGCPTVHFAIDLAIGVCRGVSAIHAANMVHRDLKPGNVVLDGGRPRIADFGSVRKLEDGEQHTRASKHSVLYRPPESFEEDVYTKAGDVYQVGLLSYQLLGGALPYDGESYLNSRERKEYAQITDLVERSLFVDEAIGRRARSLRDLCG
jgi:serine/threonine protein kinase